jgi:hypothetical protein
MKKFAKIVLIASIGAAVASYAYVKKTYPTLGNAIENVPNTKDN